MAATPTRKSARADIAPPTLLFLFGAHGDLVQRLLVPSLYNLTRDGLLGQGLHIIGVDHNTISDEAYREKLGQFLHLIPQKQNTADAIHKAASMNDSATRNKATSTPRNAAENKAASAKLKTASAHATPGAAEAALWRQLATRISYINGDFLDSATYTAIAACIARTNTCNAVFYLATAPRFFCGVIQHLAQAGLLQETEQQFRRVIIEKPFGTDLKTAQDLNAGILNVMQERQVYRIDHYLGKETVQNILVSRFANGLFEAFWNNHYVDHVQITAAETLGVEQRGTFYEHTGALRDMVPNHLFQLLAMVAMEPPAAFNADAVRNEKSKVIAAIRPQTPEEALLNSVRGQYRAGHIQGQPVAGYREEPRVDPHSNTETYVALKLWVDNWRWAGVPFYLRAGKRLSVRDTEIAICFKPAPMSPFRDTQVNRLRSNYLIIQIQPDEGMWFDFQAKRPGMPLQIDNVQMGFAYADFFSMRPSTGYETLLYDCMIGDQTLFQRADNIENGWRAVQPFLDAFATNDLVHPYEAGTNGPKAANDLLRRDKRVWHHLK